MIDDPRTPFLETLLDFATQAATYGLRVMLPAVIESYDAATHRCSATPLVMDGDVDEGGERRAVRLPTLHDVPVEFPGAGAIRVRWPLAKGDEVLLVFASSSIAKLKSVGGARGPLDPGDDRRHDLNDAVVLPVCRVKAPQDAAAMIEFTSNNLIKCGGDDPLVRKSEFMAHVHEDPSSGLTGAPTVEIAGTPKLRG